VRSGHLQHTRKQNLTSRWAMWRITLGHSARSTDAASYYEQSYEPLRLESANIRVRRTIPATLFDRQRWHYYRRRRPGSHGGERCRRSMSCHRAISQRSRFHRSPRPGNSQICLISSTVQKTSYDWWTAGIS